MRAGFLRDVDNNIKRTAHSRRVRIRFLIIIASLVLLATHCNGTKYKDIKTATEKQR